MMLASAWMLPSALALSRPKPVPIEICLMPR